MGVSTNIWSGLHRLSRTQTFVNFQYVQEPVKHVINSLFNPLPYNPEFLQPQGKSLLKTLGKGEIAGKPAFSPFPTMFSALSKIYFQFLGYIYFACKCFEFGAV